MSDRVTQTVYEDEDFCLRMEVLQGVLFMHCYVDSYSKSIRKRMLAVFDEFKAACSHFGWDAVHSYTQNPKFVKIFEGGFKIDDIEHDDETYEVWRWELQP